MVATLPSYNLGLGSIILRNKWFQRNTFIFENAFEDSKHLLQKSFRQLNEFHEARTMARSFDIGTPHLLS